MKKIFNFIIFNILLLFPFLIKAEGIENYYINATVQNNGDLLVEEYFYLNGEFNGFERIIEYNNDRVYPFDSTMESYGGSDIHNGSGIVIHEVKALDINPNFDFSNTIGNIFSEVNYASKGDFGVYTKKDKYNGVGLLIYNPSTKNKAFYIKYTLQNMAIMHNDVAELGWNIVGNSLSESIAHLKACINFPNNVESLRGWAHGPLNGNITILNNEKLQVTIDGLYSYRAIDVRATFDNNIISNSTKKTGVNALEKILKYEENKAEQANYERINQEKKREREAEESLLYFENNITRYNYNYALEKIRLVSHYDKQQELLNKLAKSKEKLDKIEEQTALESVRNAEKDPSFYNYESSFEKVYILDNQEIKRELNNRLEIVKSIIVQNEKEMEKTNYTKSVVLFLIIMGCAVTIYLKYDREFKSDFNEKYYRDFPSYIPPTTLSYLFNRKITNDALSASILDLIRKKVVTYDKVDEKNYILYNNGEKHTNLSDIENRLLKLIFNDKEKVELKNLKKDAKKKYSKFITNWTNFVETSEKVAKEEEYFVGDENTNKTSTMLTTKAMILLIPSIFLLSVFPVLSFIIWGYLIYSYFKEKRDYTKFILFIILILCIILSVVFAILVGINQHFVKGSIPYILINIIFAIIAIIYMFKALKRTQKGINEYSRWNAFKRFLEDFSRMDTRELPEIVLWEQYLVYATVLGCADKLSKVMEIKAEELGMSSEIEEFINLRDVYYVNRIITSNVRNSVSVARSAHSAATSSSSSSGGFSSGSGGGGGFSSGGGSFGGGGGGGRF